MLNYRLSRPRLLYALGCCAFGLTGLALAQSHAASGSKGAVARDAFSVFANGPAMAPESRLADLADEIGTDAKDRTQFRVLAGGVGTFHSRLVAFPARSGKNICYSLLGGKPDDPGMSYCYAPRSTSVPDGLLGERFSVVALESVTGGQVETQVFGIAEDSVKYLRVKVAGTWLDLPIKRNGFYLDLPGLANGSVGDVEATLGDGSQQSHNVQSGF